MGLTSIEKFLFDRFSSLPLGARVVSYFVFMFLYAYLLLAPRFINGQLFLPTDHPGGRRPYRGSELRMSVQGREYKFRANEDGYWSVPVVSLLPHNVRVEVHHVDSDEWFPVDFDWSTLWGQLWERDFEIAVAQNPPGVKLVASAGDTVPPSTFFSNLGTDLLEPPVALAGELILPTAAARAALESDEAKQIQGTVFKVISEVAKRPPDEIRPETALSGASAPSYAERIQIIDRLEAEYKLRIPDEHWMHLDTVGQLVDYVQKRKLMGNERPVFRY